MAGVQFLHIAPFHLHTQVPLLLATFTFTKVKFEPNMFTFTQVGPLSTLYNTVNGRAAFSKDYELTPSVVFWNCYRVTSVFLIFSTTLQLFVLSKVKFVFKLRAEHRAVLLQAPRVQSYATAVSVSLDKRGYCIVEVL